MWISYYTHFQRLQGKAPTPASDHVQRMGNFGDFVAYISAKATGRLVLIDSTQSRTSEQSRRSEQSKTSEQSEQSKTAEQSVGAIASSIDDTSALLALESIQEGTVSTYSASSGQTATATRASGTANPKIDKDQPDENQEAGKVNPEPSDGCYSRVDDAIDQTLD